MTRLQFATRIGAIRTNRFARIDSQKNPLFSWRASDSRESPQTPAIRLLTPPPPGRDSQKKGVQFGNSETIRENQAIRANLRIDSRESGHLRTEHVKTDCLTGQFYGHFRGHLRGTFVESPCGAKQEEVTLVGTLVVALVWHLWPHSRFQISWFSATGKYGCTKVWLYSEKSPRP